MGDEGRDRVARLGLPPPVPTALPGDPGFPEVPVFDPTSVKRPMSTTIRIPMPNPTRTKRLRAWRRWGTGVDGHTPEPGESGAVSAEGSVGPSGDMPRGG